ncbi:MAG: MerR family transcriptional regulator [Deltaproteobacteria bacterium]|nr:MerR family transcriptional regulator [Deltaproteobacteria bacterium]
MSGRYRINSVSEMTGVAPATLRAWERRYGVPRPERTDAAYRIYSEDDVALVRRLQRLVDEEGLAPSQAAAQVLSEADAPEASPVTGPDPWQIARGALVDAAAQLNGPLLRERLARALVMGSGAEVANRILAPALRELGERWHRGELSIAAEHLGSEAIGNALRELLRLAQPGGRAPLALLACFEHEDHVLPLYVVGLELARWGRRVEVLGARLPAGELREAVHRLDPELVALTLTRPPPEGRLEAILAATAGAVGARPWLVGGRATTTLREVLEEAGAIVVPDLASLESVRARLTKLEEIER